MAIVNFSVPEHVKASFDKAFSGRNKSAVIAELMQRAVSERATQIRRARLFEQLTAARRTRPVVSARALRGARRAGRP